jgi:hypothetical protein
MAFKERATQVVTFVFFAVIWTFLFFTIVYYGFELEPAKWRWPQLFVLMIGLVLIAFLCKIMSVEGILEDRIAARIVRTGGIEEQSDVKWTPQTRADAVIDAQVRLFKAIKRSHPERDLHTWLALTLERRKNWEGREESFYYGSTSRYSVLDLTHAPVALGLFILHREDMQAASVYGKRFERIMEPVYELIEKNEFISKWRATNPWTAANHPEVAEAIEESFKGRS